MGTWVSFNNPGSGRNETVTVEESVDSVVFALNNNRGWVSFKLTDDRQWAVRTEQVTSVIDAER